VPFTGGYDGGWRIKNNVAIQHWFERRHLWVAHHSPEWESFQPQPGDYLRFYTSRYGHSAIVRFVTSDDTLYTIEGNVGGRVALRSYPHFREYSRIEGFGIVIDPDRRRALLRALAVHALPPLDPVGSMPSRLWTPG
jgi:hypothetical protein